MAVAFRKTEKEILQSAKDLPDHNAGPSII
jgi:hypothetical protein